MGARASLTNGSANLGEGGRGRGISLANRDPLAAVFDLGKSASRTIAMGFVLALGLHAAAAARTLAIDVELVHWVDRIEMSVHEKLGATFDIDVIKPPPEPPPPEPPKEEPKPEEPPPPPPQAVKEPPKEAPPAPPAAAQAGAVMTQDPDPNEPVDLTNSFVTGSGSTYAGGVTQTNGTSTTAVRNMNARATGVPGGTGTAPAPAGPDRSRPPGLSGSSDWSNCPFPPEADTDQVDEARVQIQIVVGSSGQAERVTVTKDPGHGFGRAARQCALGKSYLPALDHEGSPVRGTKDVVINFSR
jgi:protein TonB